MTRPHEVLSTSPHFFEFPKSNAKKLGICAMDKKARSKQMGNIIERLLQYGKYEVIVFGDKVILDEPITDWPYCDFMVSFFSKNFPLHKAIAYQKLRGVFCVNNLPLQELLWDRRLVLAVLDHIGVGTPPRWIVDRDGGPRVSDDLAAILRNRLGLTLPPKVLSPVVFHVDHDTISINGQEIQKPFVEKPVSGEDHNVYIYFSAAQGGGVRKLFRKVGQAFMDVDNAEDVKVYTIGTNYTHAETRKSPVVDGLVQRNAAGKEVRYMTELTPQEKGFAFKVARSFGQAVCGIDFLRVEGTSYVIDVNGWSFVKGCPEYYDVCARYLDDILTQAAERRWFSVYLGKQPSFDDQWTLKGFLSVFRHADRTPKQKIKYGFTSAPFVDLLRGSRTEVILRREADLARVLDAADAALAAQLEEADKLEQLSSILRRKMGLEGTKVQLKPTYKQGELTKLQVILKWGGGCTHAGIHHTRELADSMRKDLLILNRRILDDVVAYSSSEQRVIATARVFCERFLKLPTLPPDFLVIRPDMLDDSNMAKDQMDQVKSRLKAFFKAHEADPAVSRGFDLPEEMRDPQTFVRGVYDLLTRVTRNMRKNLESPQVQAGILRDYHWCCQENVALFRERWEKLLQDFGRVEKNKYDPGKVGELYDSLKYDALHNRPLMDRIFVSHEPASGSTTPRSPTQRRLSDLFHDLSVQSGRDNGAVSTTTRAVSLPAAGLLASPPPSSTGSAVAVPTVRRHPGPESLSVASTAPASAPSPASPSGAQALSRNSSLSARGRTSPFPYPRSAHNRAATEPRTPEEIRELYHKAKLLFDFVTPREYGIDDQEKRDIGVLTSVPLLKRIMADLEQVMRQDGPLCRLYFTKESHIHTLLNCVFMSGLPTNFSVFEVGELDFLTQITFEVYERRRDHQGRDPEYSLRLGFSPGAYYSNVIDHSVDATHALSAAPRRDLTDHIELHKALGYFQTMLDDAPKAKPDAGPPSPGSS
ncbi:inositol hexakisphosphate and diphosphoinositol-pentakisphosphate kinase [Tieghemiomyces parasiticus]|uniref:Inositol hexakisphosphate and diphosphoinositol-pentakisphosphate kinase n=1 Tax=Tieghemiomyces parasiticus TaxID=78921 RepID=A0A9W8E1S1_9FUNG|nr:inositol hexakisphosphate and diphosphoinositol-pentakisphosphate kinase [Tieghemiomyces parasiticus]